MPKGKAEAPAATPAKPKVLRGTGAPYWDLGNPTWVGSYR